MPAQDGTGPNAQGPLTGGGFGRCGTGINDNLRTNTRFGRRFIRFGRRGFGGTGRGRGYGFFAGRGFADEQPTRSDEVQYLKSQASRLETALNDIRSQIHDLEESEG